MQKVQLKRTGLKIGDFEIYLLEKDTDDQRWKIMRDIPLAFPMPPRILSQLKPIVGTVLRY